MSFLTPQFQIVSDLYLETPLITPQYGLFCLNVQAENLFLLGDIGLVVHAMLFQFLCGILEQNSGCRIFYVLGNHEPYGTTYEHAYKLLRVFEQEANEDLGGRFKFLCRDRYNLNETITILGCTLWSAIQHNQIPAIASRSTDLNSERGIQNWTLDRHREEHEKDLVWLNTQVSNIERDEPHRQILIATHYSPTVDSRANDPQHAGSSVSSNFVTDLSQEPCWLSPTVKLWAFGHTHYNCTFRDDKTGKLVVANQKGYAGLGAGRKKVEMRVRVIEAGREGWDVVEGRKSGEQQEQEQIRATRVQTEEQVVDDGEKEVDANAPRVGLLHRIGRQIQSLRGSRQKGA